MHLKQLWLVILQLLLRLFVCITCGFQEISE